MNTWQQSIAFTFLLIFSVSDKDNHHYHKDKYENCRRNKYDFDPGFRPLDLIMWNFKHIDSVIRCTYEDMIILAN